MWQRSGIFVIKNRLFLLIGLFAATGVMGYFASKVKLSYEFAKAIPVDNVKYKSYLDFKKKFGDDETVLVGKKIMLNVIMVRNPKTGEMGRSLAFFA